MKKLYRIAAAVCAALLSLSAVPVSAIETGVSDRYAETVSVRDAERISDIKIKLSADKTELSSENSGYSAYYPEKEHPDIDYADMKYVGVDTAKTEKLLKEIEDTESGAIKVDDPAARIEELFAEVNEELKVQSTQSSLGTILHYQDVTDQESAENVVRDNQLLSELYDKYNLTARKVLTGSFKDSFSKTYSEEEKENFLSYENLTDQERELNKRELELINEYERLAEEEYTFDYKGRTWNVDMLMEDEDLSYGETRDIYTGIVKAENAAVVPVFQELVKVRKQLAELKGYDTYTDYVYEELYGRDFTGKDIAELRETVIKEIMPLYYDLQYYLDECGYDTYETEAVSGKEIVETVSSYISNVSPELQESLDYLQEHDLYCMENKENMANIGFTVALKQYGTAYVFLKTKEAFYDYESFIHEFGHYNVFHRTYFEDEDPDLLRVDLCEIHSQGMEVLFADNMEEILPDRAEWMEAYIVQSLLYCVITAFEYDEFQQEVYARGDMTADELNALAYEINQKYLGESFGDKGKNYDWVMIDHTFTQPLYYIGYGTAGLSSLNIWSLSKEDYESAVDKYLNLTALGSVKPYKETLSEAGLPDMLNPKDIKSVADALEDWIVKTGKKSVSESAGENEMFASAILPYIENSDLFSSISESDLADVLHGFMMGFVWVRRILKFLPILANLFTIIRVVSVLSWASRLVVLIVALIAHFRKKKKFKDGEYFSGGGPGSGSGFDGKNNAGGGADQG
ncbi:MAG: hypothetical protein HUJ73_07220 [Eubacterium sp.]|nr:hypothetical protein [Eubacterium sp.]